MVQTITSIAGALLMLKLVKILLPEGSIKKYASFTVSALVMLIMILSVIGRIDSFSLNIPIDSGEPYIKNSDDATSDMITREFSGRLEADMKQNIPELADCKINIAFSEATDGSYIISSVEIISDSERDKLVEDRIAGLYMIDPAVIVWRKK